MSSDDVQSEPLAYDAGEPAAPGQVYEIECSNGHTDTIPREDIKGPAATPIHWECSECGERRGLLQTPTGTVDDTPAPVQPGERNGDDHRPPHDDPDPRELLERAVERLPVEERGRAREALEAMTSPDEQAREIAALYDAVDELQGRLARALDWLNAANRRSNIVEGLLDTYRRLRQGNIRQVRYLDERLEELTDAADAVVESAQELAEAENALYRVRASQKLGRAMVEYFEVREGDDE